MKRSCKLLPIVFFGIFLAIISCKEISKESCEQDAICESKEVTACCTAGVCVYKYNGKVYTEDEKDQLAIDLGCSSAKSAGHENDLAQINKRLTALMDKVRCRTKSNE
jgi:hypothetical protein